MNHVLLIGYLGKDAETQTFENGNTKTTIEVATTERGFVTRTGQQVPDRTTWHHVVFWGGLAKMCADLKKGHRVAIQGRYESSTFAAEDGTQRMYYCVNATDIEFLTPKPIQDGEQ